MRLYETTIITDSQLEEAETEQQIKQIENLIKQGGGAIVETQRWGVRRFAYEIKGKRQGFYAYFLYEGEPGIPASLQDSFKVNEKIIRFLTVVSEIDLEAKKREIEERTPRPEPVAAAPDKEVEKDDLASKYEDEEVD